MWANRTGSWEKVAMANLIKTICKHLKIPTRSLTIKALKILYKVLSQQFSCYIKKHTHTQYFSRNTNSINT